MIIKSKKYIFKSILLIMILCLICPVFAGCSSSREKIRENSKLKIVTTLFPEYDWVRNIVGNSNRFDVQLLVDSGVDMHSYQPTADDIITISTCDLFIYNGGESDSWVKDIISTAGNKNLVVIDLMSTLGGKLKEEEAVEGMQTEEDSDEKEYDEHIWLSAKNAKLLCSSIKDALSMLDKKNEAAYAANLEAYSKKLDELDNDYAKAIKESKHDTLIFADRFPFRYLTDDYGLKYFAAFSGCSAECEASFETVSFLAQKLDELGISKLLVLENASPSLADTIISSSSSKNATVLTINSMQSVTKEDIAKNISYIELMKANLENIKQALN